MNLEQIKREHQPGGLLYEDSPDGERYCTCDDVWPCAAADLVGRVEELEAALRDVVDAEIAYRGDWFDDDLDEWDWGDDEQFGKVTWLQAAFAGARAVLASLPVREDTNQ